MQCEGVQESVWAWPCKESPPRSDVTQWKQGCEQSDFRQVTSTAHGRSHERHKIYLLTDWQLHSAMQQYKEVKKVEKHRMSPLSNFFIHTRTLLWHYFLLPQVTDKRVSRNHGLLENLNGQLRLKPVWSKLFLLFSLALTLATSKPCCCKSFTCSITRSLLFLRMV